MEKMIITHSVKKTVPRESCT